MVPGWSSAGGASVVVAQGESADMLAKRYGVPQNVLLQVNGLKTASELQPGARIVVPIYNAVATAGAPPAAPRVAAVEPPHLVAPAPRVVVAAREVERRPVVPAHVAKVETRHEKAQAAASLAPVRPVKAVAPVKVAAAPAPALPKGKVKTVAAPAVAAVAPVKVAPVKAAKLAPPPKAEQVAEAAPAKAVDPAPTASVAPAAAGPEFRWPARGRIIQGFKSGGGNDGINIAVPEGTAVKAAEGGVVAYAGSEMKAYGNLVLIRHPNGFVSAYANNGEIDVKRGDTVKRGQTIAKSGQSGNVASPQLHFELRKGTQPVDPTSYLAGL